MSDMQKREKIMTKNNENKKEVKIEVKRINANVIRKRIITDCKDNIKLTKLNESVFNNVHTQAACIDACIRLKYKVNDIADKLVTMKLCNDLTSAYKRIKRHVNHDEKSRVISRNMLLNQ
jgi:hypothetical protein